LKLCSLAATWKVLRNLSDGKRIGSTYSSMIFGVIAVRAPHGSATPYYTNHPQQYSCLTGRHPQSNTAGRRTRANSRERGRTWSVAHESGARRAAGDDKRHVSRLRIVAGGYATRAAGYP
jgi:hypothetical protein